MIACHPCPEAADIQDQPTKFFPKKLAFSELIVFLPRSKSSSGMDLAAKCGIFYALKFIKRRAKISAPTDAVTVMPAGYRYLNLEHPYRSLFVNVQK